MAQAPHDYADPSSQSCGARVIRILFTIGRQAVRAVHHEMDEGLGVFFMLRCDALKERKSLPGRRSSLPDFVIY
jgi:hypothetical protein